MGHPIHYLELYQTSYSVLQITPPPTLFHEQLLWTSKFSSYLLSFQERFLFKSEILWSRYGVCLFTGDYINLQYTVYKYALCQNCLKSSGYFKCTCASMQKGPQRDLLTTKSLLPSQRNLEIKKHGMGISHKSIFLNACPMQFEQFDVLTKAF